MTLENVEDVYPLTPLQHGILFHCIAAPENDVYVTQICYDITGEFEPRLLRDAWQSVVSRHSALRTVFLWDGVDAPLQVVNERVAIDLNEVNCAGLSTAKQDRIFEEQQRSDRAVRFDLTRAPLMRLSLLTLDNENHKLIWTVHHLISDGWSVVSIIEEVFRSVRGSRVGDSEQSTKGRPFSEYVKWLLENGGTKTAFWTEYLAGYSEPCAVRAVCGDVPGTENKGHASTGHQFDADTTSLIEQTARQLRITVSTLVHAAWSIVLSRYLDRDDIVFGSTQSGRPPELPGVENMIGPFINTVPVRVSMEGTIPVRDWLQLLQANLLALRENQYAALNEVTRLSDISPGEALFDSIVVVENYPIIDRTTADVKIETVRQTEHSNYPLALLALPGEQLQLCLVYDGREFSRDLVQQIVDHAAAAVLGMCTALDSPTANIEIMSDSERAHILQGFNRTEIDLGPARTVQSLIAFQIVTNPEGVAVRHADSQLTYGELGLATERCAAFLRSEAVGAGDIVGVCLERGVNLVVAILGVMQTGAAYLPLDPEYPEERLGFMLAHAKPKVVLTGGAGNSKIGESSVRAIDLVQAIEAEVVIAPDNRRGAPNPSDPAYVIYTSGSTAQPKGVVVTHANLSSSTLARAAYYPEPPRAFLLMSPLAFDSSVAGLFWTLVEGGTLVISEHRLEQDLDRFAQCIRHNRISHLLCLPSLFQLLADHAEPEYLQSLRTVILAGEPFPSGHLLERCRDVLGQTTLYNEYGPTEATVWCTAFDTSNHNPSERVPIGRPIANARIYILDRRAQPVPIGVPGEIYVGGPGVANGYFRSEQETQKRFVVDPYSDTEGARIYRTGDVGRYRTDGCIEFLGRSDQQVKVLGHRIELGEVETALGRHPDVIEAVAVIETESPQQGPTSIEPEDLIERLGQLSHDDAEMLLAEIEKLASMPYAEALR